MKRTDLKIIPIKIRLLKQGDDVVEELLNAVQDIGFKIKNGDIFAIADKIIATCWGRIVNLKDVKPSRKALELADKYKLEPPFVEIVLREADEVYGGVPRAIVTLKNNVLIANAGMDHKNVPQDSGLDDIGHGGSGRHHHALLRAVARTPASGAMAATPTPGSPPPRPAPPLPAR